MFTPLGCCNEKSTAEKVLIVPITQFTETLNAGVYTYFLPSSEIGISVINNVELGDGVGTFTGISNYTITTTNDVQINSNVQMVDEYVRISGQV